MYPSHYSRLNHYVDYVRVTILTTLVNVYVDLVLFTHIAGTS